MVRARHKKAVKETCTCQFKEVDAHNAFESQLVDEIYSFSHSRTIPELCQTIRNMIQEIPESCDEELGFTRKGFCLILALGDYHMRRDCFNKDKFDCLEWASLNDVLAQMVHNNDI